ncbi:MAG TPA: hypothetical protein PLO35_01275 [Candidatus Cloacimonadota bacterium]|nr:hypothetical protein [Candidatus Cloacimonadota bacterium]
MNQDRMNKWISAPAGMTILMLAVMILAAPSLAAWSITDSYFGNKYDGFEARAFAMGGAGTFNDLRPFGIAANPANLTLIKSRVGFQGALLVNRAEDNRYIPLYNSFDNYIDDAVYASNINFYDDYAGSGFASMRFGLLKLGLGGYYKPLLNFDGNYIEEIRNNRNTDNDVYPEKIAINAIENEGSLNQAAGVFSFGYELGENLELNLGAEVSLLSGEQTQMKTIRWSQWAIDTFTDAVDNPAKVLPDYTLSTETELEGTQMKGGLSMRLNNRFGLAATYTMKSTLDRTGSTHELQDAHYQNAGIDISTPIAEDYILPSEARLGFLYQPRNIMRTWFNLDVEYVKWSDVSEHFEDQVNLYAGVEHWVENRLPLRLGFQAVNGYLRELESDGSIIAKRIISPKISAGTSFALTSFLQMDLGFGYTWREFEALDLFADSYYNDKTYSGNSTYALWPNSHITLADRGWENPDKVRENNISLNAGLTFNW